MMVHMVADPQEQDFLLTIVDIFSITGHGTAVSGRIEGGAVRTGDTVEVWDGQHVVTTARATVEMITARGADPARIALVLGDLDVGLLKVGMTVRRRAKG